MEIPLQERVLSKADHPDAVVQPRYDGAVPVLTLPPSPAGAPAAAVAFREVGEGPAVVLLHGGWGYEAYPFDRQLAALSGRHRAVAPDRVGYGRSQPGGELEDGFHRRMAEETVRVLDALAIERAALWGHSDGAVVAAWTAILWPERVDALVLEALHFVAAKRRSLDFFRTAVEAPERFGDAVVAALRRDHGERWREVVAAGGRAWLRIIERGCAGEADVYGGRFGEIEAPTLLLHGTRDPRTEPGEIEAACRALPAARVAWVDAGHAPHTSAGAGERATALAVGFLDEAQGSARRAARGGAA
jgi:pimeloyl-ACP methyl ester carboxylesterase